jgi:eukaryotic-like serine/threonine-protein kinase
VSSPTITGSTVIGGRYVVERQLGYGATSTVYLCRDRQTTNLVAVKVLRAELAESLGADRFLREIRLTAGLEHPNIVPVIDSGAEGSTLYCVLPYMEGGTLRDMLLASKQLPIEQAVDIGCTIARALAYAHGKGLIHRDIKPENILFGNGRAHLGDFGIARLLHATAGDLTTTTGVVRGTPAYMSPEQASGERNYDGRSDIYSLAAVVYEMVSGMPPFTGPTAQSVLAQRFSTTPRPMRTYRSTVSAELDRVVAKAMCTSPADRQATANEFADELEAAGHARAASPWISRLASRTALAGAGALAVAIALGVWVIHSSSVRGLMSASSPTADTTVIAILPFERAPGTEPLRSIDALLYDAFSAWRGVTVVEPFRVRDVVLREGTASTVGKAGTVAKVLGAGSFVRGSLMPTPAGDGWLMQAWLHQVGKEAPVQYKSVTLHQGDLANIGPRLSEVATALLLRGQAGYGGETARPSTNDLRALQFFGDGFERLSEWDFARADTLFQRAIDADGSYARAYLWQAQVRAWQRLNPERWLALVEKSLADSARLPERDIQLAVALRFLGKEQFDSAHARYAMLRDRDPNDFAAWFGLGRSQEANHRVIRDRASPTGWRYVASYQEAMRDYQRAFEVLPLSHRSFESGAFEPLRELLFLRASKLNEAFASGPDSATILLGRLDMAGDTLVMRPVPMSLMAAGDLRAVPAGIRAAIESQRSLFRSIARSWSTALPRSAGAKEAVAVSLEMMGDRSALDTLRAARARTAPTDSLMLLRLAVADVIMRLKFLDPGNPSEAQGIQRSADSLLASHAQPSDSAAVFLAPMAALTGRCGLLRDLVTRAPFSLESRVPRDIVGASDAVTALTALGCISDPAPDLDRLRKRIEATRAPAFAVPSLLGAAARFMDPPDPRAVDLYGTPGNYLFGAQLAVLRGQVAAARQSLAKVDSARQRTGYDDVRPDAIYLESRVLLSLHDTTAAVVALDRLFDRMAFLTPAMLHRPVPLAGLLRAMDLRSEIAAARHESGAPLGWAAVKRSLWSSADPAPRSSARH